MKRQAKCIGCGCTDEEPCPDGCEWVWVDRQAGRGWCSACDDADWEPAVGAGCSSDIDPDELVEVASG